MLFAPLFPGFRPHIAAYLSGRSGSDHTLCQAVIRRRVALRPRLICSLESAACILTHVESRGTVRGVRSAATPTPVRVGVLLPLHGHAWCRPLLLVFAPEAAQLFMQHAQICQEICRGDGRASRVRAGNRPRRRLRGCSASRRVFRECRTRPRHSTAVTAVTLHSRTRSHRQHVAVSCHTSTDSAAVACHGLAGPLWPLIRITSFGRLQFTAVDSRHEHCAGNSESFRVREILFDSRCPPHDVYLHIGSCRVLC